MANLNKAVIVGHPVRDPEKQVGPSGNPFGLFTIAANCRYTDKNGQSQEEAAFVPCLTFGPAVEWLTEKKKDL
jgi:single-stranded DNA-binding protein